MEVSGQHHVPAALSPGKNSVPIDYEAGWAPEPVWTFGIVKKPLAPAEIRTPVRPAHYPLLKISFLILTT